MPRGAADGWIAPMPGSRSTGGERATYERVTLDRPEPVRFAPSPQHFETPEPARYERPMPERFERSQPVRFDPPLQRFEAPELPARFDPPPGAESRSSGRRFGREDFEPN
jgi:hypothetical protein